MKILVTGTSAGVAGPNAIWVNFGKGFAFVQNVSKEPMGLPESGTVVFEADNFTVQNNDDGTQTLVVNVINNGCLAAGGDIGIAGGGRISIYTPCGVSRGFEVVGGGQLYSGSVAISQGYGDREVTTFLDTVLFRMPSPLNKGDQVMIDGTLEIEEFQHGGRNRSKVKMVANRYNRQKGNRPKEGGAPAGTGTPPPARGGNAPAPSANAPASTPPQSGGFSRPAQAPANAPASTPPQSGGFSRPAQAPAQKPAAGTSGGGFGRPPENNLPEIDINEDEIPF